MKVALVVGHKSASPGAVNASTGVTEFEFNAHLAVDVWRKLRAASVLGESVEPEIHWRRTLEALPGDVSRTEPVFAVSMHANASFEHEVSGTEVLYYHRREVSAQMAAIFQDKFLAALGLRDRGIKAIDSEDRGGWLLGRLACDAVLCEPFFIDRDSDLVTARESDLAGAYTEATLEALKL